MKSTSNLFTLLLVLVCGYAQGQELPTEVNVIPPSPNVAAINKFIDIPVSYYTGTPNLSVPIFNLKTPQLSLPITLGYHASGQKVEENASWVGAGWALSAGGTVSRTVRGLPDELVDGGKKGYFFNDRLFKSNGQIQNDSLLAIGAEVCDFDTATVDQIVGLPEGPVSTMDSLSQGYLDTEADLYHFSFPGGSGKFVFNRQGDPIKFTKDDVAFIDHPFEHFIPTLNSTAASTDYTWRFQSPDGVLYTFKNAERTRTITSCSASTAPTGPYASTVAHQESSWHLDEMSLNGDTIRFEYAAETQVYDTRVSSSGKFRVNGAGTSINNCFNEQRVFAKRLSKITSTNGYEVVFNANTARNDLNGSSRLDNIQVKKDGLLVTQYNLSYDYFGTNEKLKLLSVNQSDGSSTLPGYTFEYFSGGSFPSKTSYAQDFWGYYNGKTSNSNLIPEYKDQNWHVNRNGANRDTDLASARLGTIQKVIYPTGGFTTFDYELNQYYNPSYDSTVRHQVTVSNGFDIKEFVLDTITSVTATLQSQDSLSSFARLEKKNGSLWQPATINNQTASARGELSAGTYRLYATDDQGLQNSMSIEYETKGAGTIDIGGLRIRDITFSHGLKTRIEYNDSSGQSSGLLFTPPILGGNITQHKVDVGNFEFYCQLSEVHQFLHINSVTQLPVAAYSGSHVGYSRVTAFKVGDQTAPVTPENGATVYEYINGQGNLNTGFPYVAQQDLGFKNGKLKKQTVYKNTTTGLERLSETENLYNEITYDTEAVYGVNISTNTTTTDCYECDISWMATNYYSIQPKFHYLDTTIQRQFFEGNLSMTSTTAYTYSDVTPRPHFMYTEKSTLTPDNQTLIEKVQRQALVPARITQQEVFDGTTQLSGTQLSYVGNLPSSISIYQRDNGGRYVQKAAHTYTGNLLTQSEAFPGTTGATKTAYVWNYNSAFPTAQVMNADKNDVAYTSFEADEGGNWTYVGATFTLASLPTGKRYYALNNGSLTASVSSATDTYIVSYWAKDGVPSVANVVGSRDAAGANGFGWKYYEKEVTGSTAITITGTGSTKIDEVRLYPKGSLMTTMTYDLRYGMTSQTSPNGLTTYYEYDSFGRLKYIKDKDGNILKMNEYEYQVPVSTVQN